MEVQNRLTVLVRLIGSNTKLLEEHLCTLVGHGFNSRHVHSNKGDSMTECDFILDQYEQFGEDYVNALMDDGFVPVYISGTGWKWIMRKLDTVRVMA